MFCPLPYTIIFYDFIFLLFDVLFESKVLHLRIADVIKVKRKNDRFLRNKASGALQPRKLFINFHNGNPEI